MTSRTIGVVTYTLSYDAENRLQSVTNTATGEVTTFTYDADGQRVKRDTMTDTVVYVGSHYEVLIEEQDIPEDLDDDCLITVIDIMQVVAHWGCQCGDACYESRYDLEGDDCDIDIADIMLVAVRWRKTCEQLAETVKYYTLGGRRVAMRKVPADPPGQVGTLYYLFSDHLGSVSLVTCGETGGCGSVPYQGLVAEQRFYPYGDRRYATGDTPTDYGFTGQKLDESTGLMYYGARYYDPALGRFVQADTVVPNPANPQDLNRYAYVRNNPLKYTDLTGHEGFTWYDWGGDEGSGRRRSYWFALSCYYATREPDPLVGAATTTALAVACEWCDWGMTLAAWSEGDFSWLDLLGLLPLIPGTLDNVGDALRAADRLEDGGDALRGMENAADAVRATGQGHHMLSDRIMRQLEQHKTLRGLFNRGDFVAQAIDEPSHWGYQAWHRAYDYEVVDWLRKNPEATREQFIQFLQQIYKLPEMRERFPDAIELLEKALR